MSYPTTWKQYQAQFSKDVATLMMQAAALSAAIRVVNGRPVEEIVGGAVLTALTTFVNAVAQPFLQPLTVDYPWLGVGVRTILWARGDRALTYDLQRQGISAGSSNLYAIFATILLYDKKAATPIII